LPKLRLRPHWRGYGVALWIAETFGEMLKTWIGRWTPLLGC
jgi:hypothetical protein